LLPRGADGELVCIALEGPAQELRNEPWPYGVGFNVNSRTIEEAAMTRKLACPAAVIGLWALAATSPATAQVQLNVCGAPPLPPCERPRVRERVIIEERGGRDFGTVCRTRNLRCRTDEPRRIGARCICEDEDGEEIVGRIVR
jgi:hypothetical protein